MGDDSKHSAKRTSSAQNLGLNREPLNRTLVSGLVWFWLYLLFVGSLCSSAVLT